MTDYKFNTGTFDIDGKISIPIGSIILEYKNDYLKSYHSKDINKPNKDRIMLTWLEPIKV